MIPDVNLRVTPEDVNTTLRDGPHHVEDLARVLTRSEAARLAVSPRVHPDARRILAARGRK